MSRTASSHCRCNSTRSKEARCENPNQGRGLSGGHERNSTILTHSRGITWSGKAHSCCGKERRWNHVRTWCGIHFRSWNHVRTLCGTHFRRLKLCPHAVRDTFLELKSCQSWKSGVAAGVPPPPTTSRRTFQWLRTKEGLGKLHVGIRFVPNCTTSHHIEPLIVAGQTDVQMHKKPTDPPHLRSGLDHWCEFGELHEATSGCR